MDYKNPEKISKAFSPGHITGIVEKISNLDILEVGSIGSGFSIEKGITTTVKAYPDEKFNYKIYINQEHKTDAEVSSYVLEQYKEISDKPYRLIIEHQSTIPIGYGLGSSGAAALSLSYALNAALEIGKSREEAAQIAHIAEIACKTGFGSVIAEYIGGLEVRTKAGSPGIGKVESWKIKDQKAIIQYFTPLYTKNITNVNNRNMNVRSMIERIKTSKSIEIFLQMSYEFCMSNNFLSNRCYNIIQSLKKEGYYSSMALFGETIFTISSSKEIDNITNILKKHGKNIIICNLDNRGARLIE